MTWEHYELYSIDEDGVEELVETDGSLKKLQLLAKESLTEYYPECVIYREDENGDLVEVERISN